AQRVRDHDAQSTQGAQRIATISNELGVRVRGMMGRLRPAILDELGLVPALQAMVDDWNLVHKDSFCSFRSNGSFEALDAEQRIALYRIVQEALTNVARHAGAERVDVQLEANDGACSLVISDDGRGCDPATLTPGMGLRGIRERAQSL